MEYFWVQITVNSIQKLILIQAKYSLLDSPIAQEFKKFWKLFLIRQDFDQSVWTRLVLIALQMKHYLFIQHCQIQFQDVPSAIRSSCFAIRKKLSGTRIKLQCYFLFQIQFLNWKQYNSAFYLVKARIFECCFAITSTDQQELAFICW